ncbi:MAG: hypothetical protein KKC20_23590 [Proteobacteria bacterium]|nr:hypothetical protein [Pseudomonadota bacterium]
MDKKEKRLPPVRITKRAFGILFVSGLICALVYGYQYKGHRQDNYDKKAIESSLEKYELAKKTEVSEQLRDPIFKIIQDRKDCYSSQVAYSERNNTCKRAYTNIIVQLARDTIKSAPMRGLFIRCIRECPIAGSLCNGEPGTNEQDCIKTEARCIEFCLDNYWRGGAFPDENNFIYKKNN